MPPPILLRLFPPILGGILRIASATGAVWYPHAVPVLLRFPPRQQQGGFFNVNYIKFHVNNININIYCFLIMTMGGVQVARHPI